ncbi:MAG: phenylalanine--tRNA ligase subunit beta [Bacteroidales bacterium]|nr:phenylalanine--tRNA ligase subunit beta [Bacteroidales bacterium]
MNISYNWLKEYLNINLSPEEVSAALTSIGLETGGIEEFQSIKGGLEGLVIGHILTCEEHPNSDHLHITTVDLGTGEPQQIVCGAANVAAGQKVVVATIGTTLYDGDESFTIKKSKIRGVESNGMICAEDEIGIGTSHDGIIVLPADAPIGTPAADYYNVKSDFVLEVDITPNRVDAASHFGVARDLAAYLAQNGVATPLAKPSVEAFVTKADSSAVSVKVENSEACPRYSGVTIKNVTVKESPEWMQNRLKAIGLRPINNIVDITNYVLHEFGHPLHCFDLKEIAGNQVIVKTVAHESTFITLDEAERKLAETDLMICNANEGMCIAGVFGGLKSGVTESTTDVFLESAYFSPMWVRKTARRHGLNTDSSFRFERGADPNNTLYVLKRAALLIQELAGGDIVGEVVDIYPTPIEKATVELTFAKINSLIGKAIPTETVKNILKTLEIEILSETEIGLTVSIPTYRVDVLRDVDVIEDILRIYGYNNVEIYEQVSATLSYKTDTDRSHKMQNLVAEQLVGSGFHEILNNSLTKSAYYNDLVTYPVGNCVKMLNPLSQDLNVMRQTLLFGGLESVAYNRNRRNSDLAFFEFGNCYRFNEEKKSEEQILAAYSESQHIGLWLCGNKVSNSWAHANEETTVYQLKAYVENIFTRLGVQTGRLAETQESDDIFATALNYHTKGGKLIASAGIVNRRILKAFDIDTPVFYADINWTLLMKEVRNSKVTYSEISKFPSVKRDLALLVDKAISFAEIQKIAFESERKLLKSVELFDVYEGKNLEAGKKSYAVSFIILDETKTLADKQIEAIMAKIQSNLEQKLGAKLR